MLVGTKLERLFQFLMIDRTTHYRPQTLRSTEEVNIFRNESGICVGIRKLIRVGFTAHFGVIGYVNDIDWNRLYEVLHSGFFADIAGENGLNDMFVLDYISMLR